VAPGCWVLACVQPASALAATVAKTAGLH